MTTEAQAAARNLPDARGPGGTQQTRGERGYAIFAIILLLAVPVVLAGFLLTQPWGWASVLAAIVLWLVCRWLWSRLAPGQVTAAVAVDTEGTVTVLSGRTMVSAQRKMITRGVGGWLIGGVVLGVVLVLGGAVLGIVIGFTLFDESVSYIPIVVELLAGTIAIAAMMYGAGIKPIRARAKGDRVLDAQVMMPLLGLYAHRHGEGAVHGGVPADRLLAVAGDATPEELAALTRQTMAMQFISNIARGGSAS